MQFDQTNFENIFAEMQYSSRLLDCSIDSAIHQNLLHYNSFENCVFEMDGDSWGVGDQTKTGLQDEGLKSPR